MRLVDNAREAWKWYSVQALAVLALLPLVWAELPAEVVDMIPAETRRWIMVAIAISGIVGRLIPQKSAE